MAVQIQVRRGTAAAWTAANPTLAEGEWGLETDTLKIKIGNGVTAWNSLAYFGSGVTDGDKGDITVTASGNTWTIDANAVSFSKIQDIATDRLIGRDTAATGDPEEVSVGNGLEFTGGPGIGIANDGVTFARMQNINTDRLIGRDTAGSGDPEEVSVGGGLEWTGGPGVQRSALTGDVTASAGNNATTIAARAVTAAKLFAASATARILGRKTAGSGDWEELTGADVEEIIWTYVKKAANEDVTNSAALQNDDHLFFTTVSGATYVIEIYLSYELQSGSAADLKVAFGEDATVRGVAVGNGFNAADAASAPLALCDQATAIPFGATANARLAIVTITYRGAGGTFRLLWAQNTATAGVYTRMRTESFLRYKRIA